MLYVVVVSLISKSSSPSYHKTMILMGKIDTQLCKSLLVSKMVSPNALYDYLINML